VATRKPRANARRNYERLLTEADAVSAEQGTDTSLEAVARRLGVAISTLYGPFPNRALVGALLRERTQALRRWIDLVVTHAASYQGLAALFADGTAGQAERLVGLTVRGFSPPERTAPAPR
jgi:AcrR family transcriptional regulator